MILDAGSNNCEIRWCAGGDVPSWCLRPLAPPVATLHCIALCEIPGDLGTRALITPALCTCGRARENRLRMQVLLALRRLSRPGLAGHDPAGGTM